MLTGSGTHPAVCTHGCTLGFLLGLLGVGGSGGGGGEQKNIKKEAAGAGRWVKKKNKYFFFNLTHPEARKEIHPTQPACNP